jgi:hypothetical protein
MNVKLSIQEAVEVHMVVRRRGYHIFQKTDSQMAVRLPALCSAYTVPPFLEFLSTPGT